MGIVPARAAEPNSQAYSRRLPYRSAAPVATDRGAIGAGVELVDYTDAEGSMESIMIGQPLVPPRGATEMDPQSVWTPSEDIVDGHGNFGPMEAEGACCDGGPVCWPGVQLNHLSIFGGLQGFKNNSTRGQDASFGFHEGLNFGTSARNVFVPEAFGWQVGFEALQTNIEGASFTDSDRKQYFFTAGGYRRSDHGWQGGLVFDYLWDDWNYELEAGQLRGEVSLAVTPLSSIGVWFASSLTEDDVIARVGGTDIAESWETVDYYTLFYRTGLFAGGRGEGQLMAGFTQDSDGIIGGKARMPMINGWALETEFTYLVPDESRSAGANEHESWNLAVGLVWYPGSLSCGQCFLQNRPLFDVANNGSLILRRR
jgi:hypothetical protein